MYAKSTSSCVVFLCAGLLAISACGSSNPAGPSGADSASAGNISVFVNPNPVPFDGKPVNDVAGCAQRPNTWYYELTLRETGGTTITFNAQVDAFDGFVVNDLKGINLQVPPNGEVKLNPRWCSATDTRHTAQHTFSGTDSNGNAVTLQTPIITLSAK